MSVALSTGAIIGIAAATSGAQAVSSIYGSRRAANTNDRSLQAGERADVRAAEESRLDREAQVREAREAREATLAYQREESARREAARREAMQFDRDRWGDYTRIQEPHWNMGANALSSLSNMMGVGGGGGMGPGGPRPGMDPRAKMPTSPIQTANLSAMMRQGGQRPPMSSRPPVGMSPGSQVPMPQQGGGMSLQDMMMLMARRQGAPAAAPTAG